jgi:hypothetical protein
VGSTGPTGPTGPGGAGSIKLVTNSWSPNTKGGNGNVFWAVAQCPAGSTIISGGGDIAFATPNQGNEQVMEILRSYPTSNASPLTGSYTGGNSNTPPAMTSGNEKNNAGWLVAFAQSAPTNQNISTVTAYALCSS